MFRQARALYHVVRLIQDPSRLDAVFAIADQLGTERAIASMLECVRRSSVGASALDSGWRLLPLDLERLGAHPPGTLGAAFARHMRSNDLDPSALPHVPAKSPAEYLKAHLYETHDIWHVVTGFGTDVDGELGLQAFYLAQFPSLHAAILLVAGLTQMALYDLGARESRLDAIVRGWRLGRAARPLFGVRWDELWSSTVEEVRRALALDLGDATPFTVRLGAGMAPALPS